MCKGFLQVPKDFFESDYWRQSRTYNECEAILDIMSQVRFEASEHTARIGGREVTWGQYQWPASVRFLSARWRWTERHVRTFLSHLKRRNIIETSDSQGVNIITLKMFIVTSVDTPSDTTNDTTNSLMFSKLVDEVTQRITQQVTQPEQMRHSTDTKHNIGNNNIDSSLRSESTHTNSACISFMEWLSKNCPYIYNHYKMLSDSEFEKLKAEYGSKAIADECMNIENRIDLRKKYSNLYRTLLNWLKRNSNDTTQTTQRAYQNPGHPTDAEMVGGVAELIRYREEKRRNGS